MRRLVLRISCRFPSRNAPEHAADGHVDGLFIAGDVAIVELHSKAIAKNGFRFDNHYCWVCYFKNNKIVRVRAYLDSAMVARLFAENRV